MPGPGYDVGLALSGGDVNTEAAYLQGKNLGSQIVLRRAQTQSALSQARERRAKAILEEDRSKALSELADKLDANNYPPELSTLIRSSADVGNLQQIMAGLSTRQEMGFRSDIADTTKPFNERQAAAQAVEGKVVNPIQYGPGGELFNDVFNPAKTPTVTPTGEAQIGADQQLALLRQEKRLHPELFRSNTSINLGGQKLSDIVVPGGQGTSIVPDTLNAEKSFGAEGVVAHAANSISDFLGLGAVAPSAAQAQQVLNELSARTQIVLRNDVPGGRPPVIVQELLGRYAEDPAQLFRGDELATTNLQTTLDSLERTTANLKKQLDLPIKRTPSDQNKLVQAYMSYTDLVADYQKVLRSLRATGNKPAQGNLSLGDESTLVHISSDEEYNSLPPGTKFIGPDGKPYQKPGG